MERENKVYLISLGCAKNLVDSEHMMGSLAAEGFEPTGRLDEAETVVINTCGFIQSAVEESIETILEAVERKSRGGLKRLVVTGCFVQRYGLKLKHELPEVDAWLGTGQLHRIAEAVKSAGASKKVPFLLSRPARLPDHTAPRIRATPFFTAFLRIAEGCSNRCSYCLIPSLRGPSRSRSTASVVEEARILAREGVKELNLISQDTTMYGKELEGEPSVEDLLERLVSVEGIEWIRLLYSHPARISDRLLDLLEAEEKICPYLDLPFQHVNAGILADMGRGPLRELPGELVDRIRSRSKEISLRATFMVGFPGETEAVFSELLNFLKGARLNHVGAFIYSPEKGTKAARLDQTVAPDEAEQRLDRLMSVQRHVSHGIHIKMVGRTLPVLLEGRSTETDLLLKGRTAGMAPDVDAQVLINRGYGVPGEIVNVRITEAHPYDLVGEIVR